MAQVPSQSVATRVTTSKRVRKKHRPWNDTLLRTKVILLILLAAVGGIGMVESHMQHQVWPLMIGLFVLCVVLIAFATTWACAPLERLIDRLHAMTVNARPSNLENLPTAREDEVGQLARWIQRFGLNAYRDKHEARRLRRTLDDRIRRATQQATSQLKRIAMRDPLTDLGNRRFLNENLPPLVQSIRDAHDDLFVILLDIDDFKQVNDQFGHGAGDELLVFLASILSASIRTDDYAVRMGGDEFLAVLPGCPEHRTIELADNMRTLFRQHVKASLPDAASADLSIGIAKFNDEMPTGASLIEKADANLYAAKHSGKARTVFA